MTEQDEKHPKKYSEKEGFEPSVPSPVQLLSREPDSTALAPLQFDDCLKIRRRWDSNPRNLAAQRFSRPPPSTTRTPLQVPGLFRVFNISKAFVFVNTDGLSDDVHYSFQVVHGQVGNLYLAPVVVPLNPDFGPENIDESLFNFPEFRSLGS